MIEETNYKCSLHGGEGDPDCPECLDKLANLLADKNCYVTGDDTLKGMVERKKEIRRPRK